MAALKPFDSTFIDICVRNVIHGIIYNTLIEKKHIHINYPKVTNNVCIKMINQVSF